ncbi:hypothetical protein [Maribacter sp. 2210JD10-5]|uniref:hypothetical protein n=1 Tax=Maribacter sp. 2210JD10-5 TaxID=3386272 RepID=UPI0039BC906B
MAISTSLPILLSTVISEIGLASGSSLEDCFANALSSGFNTTYGTISSNNLQAFRGYNNNPFNARKASSRGSACFTYNILIYYSGTTLANSSAIYTNSAKTILADEDFYYDGTTLRYWNGSSFTSTIPCSTVLSETPFILSGTTQCSPNISATYYIENGFTLANCNAFWTDVSAKNFPIAGWYEVPNSTTVRYWNGSAFTSFSTCP